MMVSVLCSNCLNDNNLSYTRGLDHWLLKVPVMNDPWQTLDSRQPWPGPACPPELDLLLLPRGSPQGLAFLSLWERRMLGVTIRLLLHCWHLYFTFVCLTVLWLSLLISKRFRIYKLTNHRTVLCRLLCLYVSIGPRLDPVIIIWKYLNELFHVSSRVVNWFSGYS